jgi:hypothetical protein
MLFIKSSMTTEIACTWELKIVISIRSFETSLLPKIESSLQMYLINHEPKNPSFYVCIQNPHNLFGRRKNVWRSSVTFKVAWVWIGSFEMVSNKGIFRQAYLKLFHTLTRVALGLPLTFSNTHPLSPLTPRTIPGCMGIPAKSVPTPPRMNSPLLLRLVWGKEGGGGEKVGC